MGSRLFNLLAWLPVAVFVEEHLVSLATVSGRSMQPTFNPDSSTLKRDVVLLSRWAASKAQAGESVWKAGDVVTMRSPVEPNATVMKRVIALPGSVVRSLPPHPERFVRVPPGHCWVEGDEPFHSRDSNTYGPVPLALLTARVDGILWPPERFGGIDSRATSWRDRVMEPRGADFGFR